MTRLCKTIAVQMGRVTMGLEGSRGGGAVKNVIAPFADPQCKDREHICHQIKKQDLQRHKGEGQTHQNGCPNDQNFA